MIFNEGRLIAVYAIAGILQTGRSAQIRVGPLSARILPDARLRLVFISGGIGMVGRVGEPRVLFVLKCSQV